jgi:hypothetical protein
MQHCHLPSLVDHHVPLNTTSAIVRFVRLEVFLGQRAATVCSLFSSVFQFLQASWVIGIHTRIIFRNTHKKKSGGVGSGDRDSHAQQRARQRNAVKSLGSRCGLSPHQVETSNSFHLLPTGSGASHSQHCPTPDVIPVCSLLNEAFSVTRCQTI